MDDAAQHLVETADSTKSFLPDVAITKASIAAPPKKQKLARLSYERLEKSRSADNNGLGDGRDMRDVPVSLLKGGNHVGEASGDGDVTVKTECADDDGLGFYHPPSPTHPPSDPPTPIDSDPQVVIHVPVPRAMRALPKLRIKRNLAVSSPAPSEGVVLRNRSNKSVGVKTRSGNKRQKRTESTEAVRLRPPRKSRKKNTTENGIKDNAIKTEKLGTYSDDTEEDVPKALSTPTDAKDTLTEVKDTPTKGCCILCGLPDTEEHKCKPGDPSTPPSTCTPSNDPLDPRGTDDSKDTARFECEECGKNFNTLKRFTAHKYSHKKGKLGKETLFPCSNCDRMFDQMSKLKMHNRVHTGDRPYPCKTCEKTFKKSDHCRRHELTHVQDLACQHCGLDVLSRAELRAHVKTEHRNLRHFQCQICDHVFKEAGHLTRHMVTHTGEKPFRCEICEACFTQQGTLKEHLVSHSGKREHRCETCGKSYLRRRYLMIHNRTHMDVLPYECSQCKKRFARRDGLTRHLQTHAGYKPHECSECERKFSRRYKLREHRQAAHNIIDPNPPLSNGAKPVEGLNHRPIQQSGSTSPSRASDMLTEIVFSAAMKIKSNMKNKEKSDGEKGSSVPVSPVKPRKPKETYIRGIEVNTQPRNEAVPIGKVPAMMPNVSSGGKAQNLEQWLGMEIDKIKQTEKEVDVKSPESGTKKRKRGQSKKGGKYEGGKTDEETSEHKDKEVGTKGAESKGAESKVVEPIARIPNDMLSEVKRDDGQHPEDPKDMETSGTEPDEKTEESQEAVTRSPRKTDNLDLLTEANPQKLLPGMATQPENYMFVCKKEGDLELGVKDEGSQDGVVPKQPEEPLTVSGKQETMVQMALSTAQMEQMSDLHHLVAAPQNQQVPAPQQAAKKAEIVPVVEEQNFSNNAYSGYRKQLMRKKNLLKMRIREEAEQQYEADQETDSQTDSMEHDLQMIQQLALQKLDQQTEMSAQSSSYAPVSTNQNVPPGGMVLQMPRQKAVPIRVQPHATQPHTLQPGVASASPALTSPAVQTESQVFIQETESPEVLVQQIHTNLQAPVPSAHPVHPAPPAPTQPAPAQPLTVGGGGASANIGTQIGIISVPISSVPPAASPVSVTPSSGYLTPSPNIGVTLQSNSQVQMIGGEAVNLQQPTSTIRSVRLNPQQLLKLQQVLQASGRVQIQAPTTQFQALPAQILASPAVHIQAPVTQNQALGAQIQASATQLMASPTVQIQAPTTQIQATQLLTAPTVPIQAPGTQILTSPTVQIQEPATQILTSPGAQIQAPTATQVFSYDIPGVNQALSSVASNEQLLHHEFVTTTIPSAHAPPSAHATTSAHATVHHQYVEDQHQTAGGTVGGYATVSDNVEVLGEQMVASESLVRDQVVHSEMGDQIVTADSSMVGEQMVMSDAMMAEQMVVTESVVNETVIDGTESIQETVLPAEQVYTIVDWVDQKQ